VESYSLKKVDAKKHGKKFNDDQLEKTVQGSSYIPNPVAGDAPEGVFRPTPQPANRSPVRSPAMSPMTNSSGSTGSVGVLSPQEQRKQKLYHRAVINKLQDKNSTEASNAAILAAM